ncbi:MAG: D-Ala-D-Ala carboxypeptidase family metallohydrolase [Prevotellaceae bacterium]|nr:D-Ala-D-Ala carboxypeptidase family metallohydrolase [Prevotellaceae bacterium]
MKHFTIGELTRSDTARKKGIDNTPTEDVVHNLTSLVDDCLDPLREAYGKPISVNSGYRCPELNRAVGGSAKSSHMDGHAADITGGSTGENQRLWNIMVEKRIPFTKMIAEDGFRWLHISYDRRNVARRKMLGIRDGGGWKYIEVK